MWQCSPFDLEIISILIVRHSHHSTIHTVPVHIIRGEWSIAIQKGIGQLWIQDNLTSSTLLYCRSDIANTCFSSSTRSMRARRLNHITRVWGFLMQADRQTVEGISLRRGDLQPFQPRLAGIVPQKKKAGVDYHVPIFRSSPCHGSHTRGPRDDGFIVGV